MVKNKINQLINSSWFSWFMFFLCPFLAFPLAIKGCYKNNYKSYILFSMLMGLSAMLLYPPRADSYTHYLQFNDIAMMNWEELMFFLSLNVKTDFILFLLEYAIIQWNLSYGFVRAILVVVACLLYLIIYDYFCKSSRLQDINKKKLFWYIILIVPVASISSGLRYGFAATLISFFICKRYLLNKKSVFDYLFLIISIFFHMAMIMILPILLLRYLHIYPKQKLYFYILFAILFFMSNTIIFIVQILPLGELGGLIQMYTEGKFSDTSYLTGNIFYWMPIIVSYLTSILIMFLCINKLPLNRNNSIVYNLFLLWSITFSFWSINGRVMFFFSLYALIFLVYHCAYKKIIKIYYNIFIMDIVINLIIGWRIHTITHWPYLFTPFPIAVTQDYTDEWVEKNINPKTRDPYIYSP